MKKGSGTTKCKCKKINGKGITICGPRCQCKIAGRKCGSACHNCLTCTWKLER
jgi:hypothetical protein